MRILFFSNRRLERNGLLRNLQNFANLGDRNVHALGDFFAGRLASEFLHQLPAGTHQLVDRFDHVHRNADGAGLVGDGSRNGLANPPRRVGRKFVAAAPLKLIYRFHQPDVAFLNQIQKLQSAVGIFFRNGNHQAKVGFNQFFFCLVGFRFTAMDEGKSAL